MRRGSLAFEAPEGGMTLDSKRESEAGAGSVRRFPLSEACSGLVGMKVRPEEGLCLISTVNDRRACFRKIVSRLNRVWLKADGQGGLPVKSHHLVQVAKSGCRRLPQKSWRDGKAKPLAMLFEGIGGATRLLFKTNTWRPSHPLPSAMQPRHDR